MKIYSESGYINIEGILDAGYPFNFIVGGRGTGKTFTTLKTAVETERKFMFMRRTQAQSDLISKPEFSVFKPLNSELGWSVAVKSISKYNSMFYIPEEQDISRVLGFTCALSTISNMRGFDASDLDLIIYDEFIPEPHERLIKNEAAALFNAYETMNRNRELSGIPPIQLLCLANANDITNPVFEELKLIRIADKMQKSQAERWTDDKRGIQIIMLSHSKISTAKAGTALYRLTTGSDFSAMALANEFSVDRSHVKSRPLAEYQPVCSIGELCIYRHKSGGRLYASTHLDGVFNRSYTLSESDREHYRRVYRSHWDLYISSKIDFEDLLSEKLFLKYWS